MVPEIDENPIVEASKLGYLFQYGFTISATLMFFAGALSYAWTSPTLPLLLAVDSPVPITRDESSWIVSYMMIGMVIATFPTAALMDKFGRKITLLLSAVPLLIAWILILTAKTVVYLYMARILSGLSYGMAYGVIALYLGEIASDKIRGSIGTIIVLMGKFGILYVYSIGPYVSISTMAYLGILPILIFLITFIWLPESPYFLLGKNKYDEARRSLARFRQLAESDVQSELNRMEMAVRKSQENHGTLKELLARGNRRSLTIILGLAAIQQLCGSPAVIAYSQQIFDNIGSKLGGSELSIILGFVQVIAAGISTTIVDRWGRRPLLLLSTSGAAICNFIIGTYFHLLRYAIPIDNISWIPLLAVMIFIISYTIGLSTVPFAILGEIFPKNIKALAAAFYTIFAAVVSFGVGKLYQIVTDDLGSDVTFFGFATLTTLAIIFVYAFIPETKGKPLDVILIQLNSKILIKNIK